MTNTRFNLDRNAWHEPYQERTYRAFPPTDFIMEPMRFLYDRGFEVFPLNKTLVFPSSYLPSTSVEAITSTTRFYLFMSQHGAVFLATDADYVERMSKKFHPHINPEHREFYVAGSPKGIDEVVERTFAGVHIVEPATLTLRRI